MRCVSCGTDNHPSFTTCEQCGQALAAESPSPQAGGPSVRLGGLLGPFAGPESVGGQAAVPARYPALRTIATVCMVVGWLVLVAAAVMVLLGLGEKSELGRFLYLVAAMVAGIGGLLLLATGESTRVLVDIEQNTRELALNARASKIKT